MSKFNIIYRITNLVNLKIYIGCHQTDNLNDGYMGSGTALHRAFKKYGIEKFKRDVLFNLDTPEQMFEKEEELVNASFVKRKDTYNILLGGEHRNTKGFICVENSNNDRIMMEKDDPRYKTEYFPLQAGKVLVKNNENIYCMMDKKDPRYKTEYFPSNTTKLIVKDENGKKFRINKDDPRYLSGELISIHKNKILVKDKNNNHFSVNRDDPRYLSGELVYWSSGKKLSKEHKEKISKANKLSQKGERNSQYGKCWITNGEESKKIYKGDLIPDGWRLGRKINKQL